MTRLCARPIMRMLGLALALGAALFLSNVFLVLRPSSFPLVSGFLAPLFKRPESCRGGILQTSYCADVRDDSVSFERPYVYSGRVDLRVVVLTYNRPGYLRELLESVGKVEMDGGLMSVEIWIDRAGSGSVDNATLEVSANFSRSNNYTTVHVHRQHAGLYNQWISTYSSDHLKEGETEIVLFLEDDLLISKYSYRWLKAVHVHFNDDPHYLGTSLRSLSSMHPVRVSIPANETVFMHRFFSTHAFSPKLRVWSSFQKWFVDHYSRQSFKPYVPNIRPTAWYQKFERQKRTNTMWSMWMIYYTYVEQLFAVYIHPRALSGLRSEPEKTSVGNQTSKPKRPPTPCLCVDRQAKGLHFGRGGGSKCPLVEEWDERFVDFPKKVIRIDWSGLASA